MKKATQVPGFARHESGFYIPVNESGVLLPLPEIKTVDVTALEWWDKVNANSYFSADITLNYGMPDAYQIKIPYEYGYGDFYRQKAKEVLNALGFGPSLNLWQYCRENGIVCRFTKYENCKKRELFRP